MTSVKVGQVWSIIFELSMRANVTVLRIEGDKAICKTGSGREHAFSVRTLERGARSAKLMTHANGASAEAPRFVMPKKEKAPEKPAPLRRQPPQPRGAPSPRARRAYELSQQGKSSAEIAALMGIHQNTAKNYCTAMRQELGLT